MNKLLLLLFLSFSYANLLRPVDNDNLHYIHIPFEWEQELNAISYNLQVSNTPTFSSLILDIQENSTVFILSLIHI